MVNNLPAVTSQPGTSLLERMGPSNSHLSKRHKKRQNSKYLQDSDMKQAVNSWLQKIGTNFFYTRLGAIVV
jgi:hypothetical protein